MFNKACRSTNNLHKVSILIEHILTNIVIDLYEKPQFTDRYNHMLLELFLLTGRFQNE